MREWDENFSWGHEKWGSSLICASRLWPRSREPLLWLKTSDAGYEGGDADVSVFTGLNGRVKRGDEGGWKWEEGDRGGSGTAEGTEIERKAVERMARVMAQREEVWAGDKGGWDSGKGGSGGAIDREGRDKGWMLTQAASWYRWPGGGEAGLNTPTPLLGGIFPKKCNK